MTLSLTIETVPCFKDNLSYLVLLPDCDSASQNCPNAVNAIAIDPGEAPPFIHALDQLQKKFGRPVHLAAVIATHHHQDHIGGLHDLPSVPTWTSQRDRNRVTPAGQEGAVMALDEQHTYTWKDITGKSAAIPCEINVLKIPGHTEGQIAIQFKAGPDSNLFVGDTLFSFGCGRCLEGTPEQLFASLQKIMSLHPETRLYFGHEYTLRNIAFWIEMKRRFPSETVNLVNEEGMTSLAHSLNPRNQLPKFDGLCVRQAPRLRDEMALNPFLKIKNATDFRRWRLRRNDF
jgi:hydroxyacylglutathione hydrolase